MGKSKKHKKDEGRRSERNRSKSRHKEKSKKSKRKYSRSSSASTSSSASFESLPRNRSKERLLDNVKLLQTLEERRKKDALERKRLKEELKAKETPEQKRERRLREKSAKELRRRERMGWDNEYQNYTNQDNPFGDSNLTSTFVWTKKLQKEGLKDVSLQTVEAINRQKQLENKLELEKVKKRRVERERERQAREEDLVLQQRQKEAAQFHEWEQQEDQFHLEQAKLRSEIRIQDGRAKPIDLLAQYISNTKLEDANAIEMQMHEPYYILNGLDIQDLEDLLIDINVYIELEKGEHIDFWNDMTIVTQDELHRQRKQAEYEAVITNRRDGIHESVVKDVTNIFRNKTIPQLNELRNKIESKIENRIEGTDISYWENILSQLKAHMAKARLREYHQMKLREKLEILKTASVKEEDKDGTSNNSQNGSPESKPSDGKTVEAMAEENLEHLHDDSFRLYEEGRYSPVYMPENATLPQFSIVMDDEEDEEILRTLRQELFDKNQENASKTEEELQMHFEAKQGMTIDEVEFSVEMPIDNNESMQLLADKYRPRKPRYFNRVHTGFEWNKYNQTHYDMDNPPPKIVQGYKFNIFYPDLIDKSKTPQYFLSHCEDNADFAVLRFHAGPPYEDIAFKIVHREWEFSYKRGFRCQFQNNIFQLWFHFKRYRYRR